MEYSAAWQLHSLLQSTGIVLLKWHFKFTKFILHTFSICSDQHLSWWKPPCILPLSRKVWCSTIFQHSNSSHCIEKNTGFEFPYVPMKRHKTHDTFDYGQAIAGFRWEHYGITELYHGVALLHYSFTISRGYLCVITVTFRILSMSLLPSRFKNMNAASELLTKRFPSLPDADSPESPLDRILWGRRGRSGRIP